MRWLVPIVAGLPALAAAPTAALGYGPRVSFELNCMGCHGADGAGHEGRVPSLRRSLVQFSGTPAGREFVLRVPGVAQSSLSDGETAALLNWMARALSDLAPAAGFVDYTAEEVARFRHEPLADVAAARARLVQAAGRPGGGERARRLQSR